MLEKTYLVLVAFAKLVICPPVSVQPESISGFGQCFGRCSVKIESTSTVIPHLYTPFGSSIPFTSFMPGVVFTAYTFTDETTSRGLCSLQYLTVTLDNAYTPPLETVMSDWTLSSSLVTSTFLLDLGLNCSELAAVNTIMQTITTVFTAGTAVGTPRTLPTPAPVAGTPTVSSTSTSSNPTGISNTTNNTAAAPSLPVPWPNPQTRIALGVGISIGSILMLSSLVFGIRRYRRKRSTANSSNGRTAEDPPYLQQKGELDANGNTVYEIDGRERRHELEGGTEIHEMATNFDGRIELRGEEHRSELRA